VQFRRPNLTAQTGTLLAAIRFGIRAPPVDAALRIDVELEPLNDPDCLELWPASGGIVAGTDGALRYARDDHHLIGVIECDEREHGGIAGAAEWTYAAIRRFQRHSPYPHLLRIWNYFDAINEGTGDLERYRQFCVGRARGLGDTAAELYPAASAIGRKVTTHRLQVYWLAARASGACVENPRQVSAYRYPREHGPSPPSFARAMEVADGSLLISGTASIVGHESQHHGDPVAQVAETIRNLKALTTTSATARTAAQQTALLKVYLREPAQRAAIEQQLRHAWPNVTLLFLAADICRRELLLEIEGIIAAC
jgi:chorismate lyase / 3-hydroxybenzoate synthase